MEEARRQRAMDCPFADPARQARSARAFAAVGWPFLWILSFGHAKESISPSGATNRIRMAFAERIRFRKLIFDHVLSSGVYALRVKTCQALADFRQPRTMPLNAP